MIRGPDLVLCCGMILPLVSQTPKTGLIIYFYKGKYQAPALNLSQVSIVLSRVQLAGGRFKSKLKETAFHSSCTDAVDLVARHQMWPNYLDKFKEEKPLGDNNIQTHHLLLRVSFLLAGAFYVYHYMFRLLF